MNPWKESPGIPAALIEDYAKNEYDFKLDNSGSCRVYGDVVHLLSRQDQDSIRIRTVGMVGRFSHRIGP